MFDWFKTFCALFAWRFEFTWGGWSFEQNAITGQRRALINVSGHVPLPLNHEWLRDGDVCIGHNGVPVRVQRPTAAELAAQEAAQERAKAHGEQLVVRDAASGEFVEPEEALTRPESTVTETIARPMPPPKAPRKKRAAKKPAAKKK